MTRTLLVAGTASHVGKSTVVAGLCRSLAGEGVDVAPFKAQNMSNNARAVPRAAGSGAGEIGVSQYVQARAAGLLPTTDVNPVLLKPRGQRESQLVIHGSAVANVSASGYYDAHWERARVAAEAAYDRLASRHDVVVIEGAGSMGEINFHDRDLANIEPCRFADPAVLLVGDIDRGGVFASLLGTLELLPQDVRERVTGAVITKFRGDRSLLEPGVATFEERTGVPIVGVIPHEDPGLPAEDSVSLPDGDERVVVGEDSIPDHRSVTVAVPRLPRISNFTDLAPLAREPGVRVAWLPPHASLREADALVLPGSKNTVDDLRTLQTAGFGAELGRFNGPVVGICGGYQMLGERILRADIESAVSDRSVVEGFGRLPVETRFSTDKRVARVTRELRGGGLLGDTTGTVSGYEIHMGETTATASIEQPFEGHGAVTDRVLGTYLHGLFENEVVRSSFLDAVFSTAGLSRPDPGPDHREPYDLAAALVDHIDRDALGL